MYTVKETNGCVIAISDRPSEEGCGGREDHLPNKEERRGGKDKINT